MGNFIKIRTFSLIFPLISKHVSDFWIGGTSRFSVTPFFGDDLDHLKLNEKIVFTDLIFIDGSELGSGLTWVELLGWMLSLGSWLAC